MNKGHPVLGRFAAYQDALALCAENVSYRTLCARVFECLSAVSQIRDSKIALYLSGALEFLTVLLAAEYAGKSVLILSPELKEKDVTELCRTHQVRVLISRQKFRGFPGKILGPESLTGPLSARPYRPGRIILTTTGSTGTPKGVVHDWKTLLRNVSRAEKGKAGVWLLTYDPAGFAGMQVILHALTSGGSLVEGGDDPVGAVKRCGVTHISATPSFWRKFLLQIKPGEIRSVKQITLGGEKVTQDLLDKLCRFFPDVPITQIYASTEMGACFYVRDKKAGLPAGVLKEKGEVQAKIVEGELYLKSKRRMIGYSRGSVSLKGEGWFPTGDRVKVARGRIYFEGRKQEIINVGGFKVFPSEVEEVIYGAGGVLLCRVSGKPSGVLGQVVHADIEVKPGYEKKKVLAAVEAVCREKLARPKVPRSIRVSSKTLVARSKIKRRS